MIDILLAFILGLIVGELATIFCLSLVIAGRRGDDEEGGGK